MSIDTVVNNGFFGLAVGAAYGACFTTPIGVAGCAIYGATMFASHSAIYNLISAVGINRLQGSIHVISSIALSIFSVYCSFFAANAVCTIFGYSVNVIPTLSLAVSTLIKGSLGTFLLSGVLAVSVLGLSSLGMLAFGLANIAMNRARH